MQPRGQVEWPCPAKLPGDPQAPALRGEAKQQHDVVIRVSSKQNQATVICSPGEPEPSGETQSLDMNQGF